MCGDDPAPTSSPLDELMVRYRHWMVVDRQLASRTIKRYEKGARLFLGSRVCQRRGPVDLDGLREKEVTAFILVEASRGLSAGSLQGRVAELRSLLRFLYLEKMIPVPLG